MFFEGVIDDYKLLEDMNKATAKKYLSMKQMTDSIMQSLESSSAKRNDLVCLFLFRWNSKAFLDESIMPYLDQINSIEEGTKTLELAVISLDNYVKALGVLCFYVVV